MLKAHGLALFVKDFFFTASVYFLSDILPPLAQLSRAFQKTAIDFSMVRPLVQGTKDCTKKLTTEEGEIFSKFSTDNLVMYGFQEYTAERMSRFKTQVYQPYLNTLSQHLDFRFPDVGLLEAFSIFDPSVMTKQSESELLTKLEVLTEHYGPNQIIDPESNHVNTSVFIDLSCVLLTCKNYQRMI